MSKTFQALSAAKVKSLVKQSGRYCDGEGLWLFVSSPKSSSWIFRFSKGGRQRDMGLGSARDVTLSDARALAAKARNVLAMGNDPMEARRADAQQALLVASRNVTFKEAADEYIAVHEGSWANEKHKQQWRNTLTSYVHPHLGYLSVQDIDPDAVVKVLRPLWHDKPETARRVRARIEMILDAAKAKGARDGENPARWRGHLEHLLGEKNRKQRQVKNHASLPYRDMPTFMAELRLQAGIAAEALQFLIYTAARTGEVIGAIDNETNCKTRVWTVPGERMKAGKDHRVALSDPALKILASRQWSGGVIFRAGPYKGALSNAAMAAVLARMGRSDITVHGMRSSFRTWVRETRPEDREAAELALAHVVGDDTERAYARGDLLERRKILMGAWAEYCLSADQQAEVIPIRI